ncbi:Phosphorylated carbohydrates phosphatase [Hordeum vulgare]|nr:Phosphorylated carbohydrates phosphatase [Hordeum vulgare]
MQAVLDEDARLLGWVYCRSLTTAEAEARMLRWKNANVLWIAIEQSEREAAEAATELSWLVKLKQLYDREVRRLKGLVILSNTSHDDDEHDSSWDDSNDPPPVTSAYTCANDRKGKRCARMW